MNIVTIENSISTSFEEKIEEYRQQLVNHYLLNEAGEPREELDESQVEDIDSSAETAAQLAGEKFWPYVAGLMSEILTLQKAITRRVPAGAASLASTTTVSSTISVPPNVEEAFNAKKHSAYLCFIGWLKQHPDEELKTLDKSNGNWMKIVGARWTAKSQSQKNEFYLAHRSHVWPHVNFGVHVRSRQAGSAYNFFQKSQKGKGLTSKQISEKWNGMTDAEKAPFKEQSEAEKRGQEAVLVIQTSLNPPTGIIPTKAAAATPGELKAGDLPFILFQKDHNGLGMSQKEIGAKWRSLSDAKKGVYAKRLEELKKIQA